MMSHEMRTGQRSGETLRLFVALPLPAAVSEQIAGVQEQLRPNRWPIKWVEPSLAHITLKFLGETDTMLAPEIQSRLHAVTGAFQAIRLQTAGCGAFPSLKRPQVLWLGVEGDLDAAERLAGSVDRAMADLEFAPERRAFRPHITLGRVRRGEKLPHGAGPIIERVTAEPVALDIDRLQLVQSVLGRSGPIYTTLAEWQFGSATATRVELVEHG